MVNSILIRGMALGVVPTNRLTRQCYRRIYSHYLSKTLFFLPKCSQIYRRAQGTECVTQALLSTIRSYGSNVMVTQSHQRNLSRNVGSWTEWYPVSQSVRLSGNKAYINNLHVCRIGGEYYRTHALHGLWVYFSNLRQARRSCLINIGEDRWHTVRPTPMGSPQFWDLKLFNVFNTVFLVGIEESTLSFLCHISLQNWKLLSKAHKGESWGSRW